MKVQNADVFRTREALPKLMAEKFPVLVSYKLAKLAEKMNGELKVLEVARNALVKKYGKTDEKGNVKVAEDGEEYPKFVEEFNLLMEQEVSLDVAAVRLPEKVAGTCDSCHHNLDRAFEIEAMVLLQMGPFIEVSENGNSPAK